MELADTLEPRIRIDPPRFEDQRFEIEEVAASLSTNRPNNLGNVSPGTAAVLRPLPD